jgi:methyltransferase (TIGR00027 family)
MATATQRGLHRLLDEDPWVFDDPFALSLVGEAWMPIASRIGEQATRGRAFLLARARYVEDRLAASTFSQYVILGAGLDSFAWRRPDLVRNGLCVFEVDHPASTDWKRRRAAELALPIAGRHVLVPTDFEQDALLETLTAAGFDGSQATLFSWLGVAMYLSKEAIADTLGAVAGCAVGSEIVWTYWPAADELDDEDRTWREQLAARQADDGEPIVTMLTAAGAEALAAQCGLTVVTHPTSSDLHNAYFDGRSDGLSPTTGERLIVGGCISPRLAGQRGVGRGGSRGRDPGDRDRARPRGRKRHQVR